MNKDIARVRLSKCIQEAERALDDALLRQSALLTTMVSARREADVGPYVGHESLLKLVRSQQSLLAAGGDMARVHGGLLQIQFEETGLDDCPPNEPMGVDNLKQTA